MKLPSIPDGVPSPTSIIMKVFKVPIYSLVISLVVSFICFIIYMTSTYGIVTTTFQARKLQWMAQSSAKTVENWDIMYQIAPAYDKSRYSFKFELEHYSVETDVPNYSKKNVVDMGYTPSNQM